MPRNFLIFKILETVPLQTVKIFDDDEDEPEMLGVISINKYNALLEKHNEIKNSLISDDQKYNQIRALWFSNTSEPIQISSSRIGLLATTKIFNDTIDNHTGSGTRTGIGSGNGSEYGVRTAEVLRILKKLGVSADTSKIAKECDVSVCYVNQLRARLGISRKRGQHEDKGQKDKIVEALREEPEAYSLDIAERFGVSPFYVNLLRSLNGIKGKTGPRIGNGKSDQILLDLKINSSIVKMAVKWEVSESYIRTLMIEKYGSSSIKKLA